MIDLVRWAPEDTEVLYEHLEAEPELWQHLGVKVEHGTLESLKQVMHILTLAPNALVRGVWEDGVLQGMVSVYPIHYDKGHGLPHIILFPAMRGKAKEVMTIGEEELKVMGIHHLAAVSHNAAHARWLRSLGYAPPEQTIYTKELLS